MNSTTANKATLKMPGVVAQLPANYGDSQLASFDRDTTERVEHLERTKRAVKSATASIARLGAPAPRTDLAQEAWLIALELPYLRIGLATAVRRGLQLAIARWCAVASISEHAARDVARVNQRGSAEWAERLTDGSDIEADLPAQWGEWLTDGSDIEADLIANDLASQIRREIDRLMDDVSDRDRELLLASLGLDDDPVPPREIAARAGIEVISVHRMLAKWRHRARQDRRLVDLYEQLN